MKLKLSCGQSLRCLGQTCRPFVGLTLSVRILTPKPGSFVTGNNCNKESFMSQCIPQKSLNLKILVLLLWAPGTTGHLQHGKLPCLHSTCIHSLKLILQIIAHSVVYNHRNLLSHSSGSQISIIKVSAEPHSREESFFFSSSFEWLLALPDLQQPNSNL